MANERPLPGLASIGAACNPMSDEEITLADLLTEARRVERDCDGPTVSALAALLRWFDGRPDRARAVLSAVCTAAVLEASRG